MFSKYEEQEGKLLREELVRLQVDIIELPLLNESFESSQQSGEGMLHSRELIYLQDF